MICFRDSGCSRRVSVVGGLLVGLGWLAFLTIIFSKIIQNQLASHPTSAQESQLYFKDDFASGPDETFWEAPPVIGLGINCFYPAPWQTRKSLLVLSVAKKVSYCYGHMQPFRGQQISSRRRFTPPFRIRARLRAASGPGVVSAIFTYTDPLDGSPHFENDIEFPSRTFSRRAVWLNNYGPLQPPDEGTPQFLPIGFDAASEFAEYTIEVYEHATVWKINGKTISRFTHAEKAEPQRVVMNTWFRRRAWPRAYEGKSPYTNAGTDFMIDWVEVSSLDKTAPEAQ